MAVELGKVDEVKRILKTIITAHHLEGGLLSTEDGLALAYHLSPQVDPDFLAGSLSAVVSTIQGVVEDINKKGFKEIIIQTNDGFIAIGYIEGSVIALLAPSKANVGMVIAVLRKTIQAISKL